MTNDYASLLKKCLKASCFSVIFSNLFKSSGYFASGGQIAPCYFVFWRQNSPNDYFALSAKIALSLILTQTVTLTQTLAQILTLIPTLALTQTEEIHYFASRAVEAK